MKVTRKAVIYGLALLAVVGALVFEGTLSRARAAANPQPVISVTPVKGALGTLVKVEGKGWPAGAELNIGLDDNNAGPSGSYAQPIASDRGEFAFQFALSVYPNGELIKPGKVMLVAYDTERSTSASATYEVAGGITLPRSGVSIDITLLIAVLAIASLGAGVFLARRDITR
jgi:hypothetical protein